VPGNSERLVTTAVREGLDRWSVESPNSPAFVGQMQRHTFSELVNHLKAHRDPVKVLGQNPTEGKFFPLVMDGTDDAIVRLLYCLYWRIPFALLRDSLPEVAAETTRHRVSRAVAGQDEAAIIFTSGSTGTPKGAVFTWEALEARWRMFRPPANTPSQSIVAGITYGLDSMAALHSLGRVESGSTAVILNPHSQSMSDFVSKIIGNNVTELAMMPSLARILGHYLYSQNLQIPGVTRIRLGAERPRFEDVYLLSRAVSPDAHLTSAFASTEGGVLFQFNMPISNIPDEGPIPLGAPVPSVMFEPFGSEAGVFRAVVSGGVASRYLDESEGQNDPGVFVDEDGTRRWISSDLFRQLNSDSQNLEWEFVGRTDNAIKIRGRLVNLHTIEDIIVGSPVVSDVAVIAQPRAGGHDIVAHVVLRSDETIDGFRDWIDQTLTNHARPSRIITHAEMPRNSRGKIDRKALEVFQNTGRPDA
jgi:acyl-coenzyme A synthetase/AMP-(fatty) acid ligase